MLQVHTNRRTALHTAAVNGSLEEVQRVVEGGIALDYGDTFGRTALWGAAKSGHKNIIIYLLENGSCMNIPDLLGSDAYCHCHQRGPLESRRCVSGSRPSNNVQRCRMSKQSVTQSIRMW